MKKPQEKEQNSSYSITYNRFIIRGISTKYNTFLNHHNFNRFQTLYDMIDDHKPFFKSKLSMNKYSHLSSEKFSKINQIKINLPIFSEKKTFVCATLWAIFPGGSICGVFRSFKKWQDIDSIITIKNEYSIIKILALQLRCFFKKNLQAINEHGLNCMLLQHLFGVAVKLQLYVQKI